MCAYKGCSNSPEGEEIKALVANGQIVPTAITISLLMKAINASVTNVRLLTHTHVSSPSLYETKKFLIDGFPRGLEQAMELEHSFREIDTILQGVYGVDAALWRRRWRLFFLATAGLFGHAGGAEWGVGHYRLKPAQR